jgi:hypothetical protein
MITKPSLQIKSSSGVIVGAFLGLTILANAFAAYFVAQERYVYYWDLSYYWIKYLHISAYLECSAKRWLAGPTAAMDDQNSTATLEACHSLQPGAGSDRSAAHLLAAARSLIASIRHSDYNPIPVLPLVPFEWLFGPSRLTYILAVTNLFLLPGALLLGLLAQRVVRLSPANRFLLPLVLATASILMLHPLWVPVLSGYPDVVGIVAIGAILLLHFAKPLAEQKLYTLIATGVLLCLLVLLRRWYAFWVAAFFPALTIAQGLDIYLRHGMAWWYYMATARNAVIIGLTFILALFGLATPFALRAIRTDYSDIYSAYRSSISLLEVAGSIPSYFGWLVLVGGLTGLSWLAVRKETRVVGSFLIAQSFITSVMFARTQDFGAQHYYLLLPGIALGIAVVVINVWTWITNRLWRVASVVLLFTALLANSSIVLSQRAAGLSDVLGSLGPNARSYPLVRNDIDVIEQLLNHLDELESQERGDIYVLASSDVLNSSIVQNYCELGPRRWFFCDRILRSNDVDKRDGFPHQFVHASYLVVASPTQYHLRADDQRVIGVLAREVTGGYGIGVSFERLPGEFKLDNGVSARVYTKVRPLERTDLDSLADQFAIYYPDKRDIFRIVDE